MTHKIKRPEPEQEYMVTGAACVQFNVSADYLKTKRVEGELRQWIHWVYLPGTPKILWRINLLRDWFANGGNCPAHQRAIEKYLALLN